MRQRILAPYQQNEGRNGYRMIRIKLRKEGIFISGKTVLALGIRSCVRVKKRKEVGKTSHIALNLLQCNFTAAKLKEKWVMPGANAVIKSFFSTLITVSLRTLMNQNG
ncbi:hypothetical protein [Aggregatibacter actinomycetemcomitans]|uniref:hypothetical protein n=1 Tax=Aggregatibacter actinomycetemcomitans TaxID=714 RepID=UPI0011D390C0|nr:hypothetical protein [Aggregatibacter actinomycetemcomitans]TYA32241.1 hypothetical protein FXB69_08560 [Aggregatibacter actinomycetemcomitans]